MYPRLSDLFSDVLGIELPFPIYSFGFMVAVALLTAAWLTGRELDRMRRQGRIDAVRLPARDKRGTVKAPPSELMGTMLLIAAGAGIVGAKIFHILENFGEFVLHPAAMIFSAGGLTFYGGFLCAGAALAYYVRQKGIPVSAMADAVAPGLILGYGIGRSGCHLAGDGDWGITANMALKPEWLPTWLWAETYPNNILGIDIPAPGVYPTSIYEFVAAVAIFGVLWVVRKHPFKGGWLFSLYLVLSGVERFLIEQIRVNNEYELFGVTPTQAEIISTVTVIAGIFGLVWLTRRRSSTEELSVDPSSEAVTSS
jgi:phosphatidylglycerol:prolipoprotein diacylglycerol transferase